MSEPRNIVLILGNGFDLDLGLKTSYKDFWESNFCPQDYPAPLIHHLNRKLAGHIHDVRWYDLENELLEYVNNEDKTDIITEEERNYLEAIPDWRIGEITLFPFDDRYSKPLMTKGIIRIEENNFGQQVVYIPHKNDLSLDAISRDRNALLLIKKYLSNYLQSITTNSDPYRYNTPFQVFRTLTDNMDNEPTLHVYSFNYTSIPWGFSADYRDIIHYVHGNCRNDNIIIGTRDEDMEKDYCFLQKAFDKHFSPPPIVEDLDFADEVIIYGHSLGLNDRQYFKPFFTKQSGFDQSRKKDITIITRDDESEIEIKRSLQQLTDNQLSVLMSKNNVRFIKTDNLIEDASELNNFLIQHGTSVRDAMEIIGKIVEYKKSLLA